MTYYLIDTTDLNNLIKITEHDFNGETPPVLADAKKQKWVEMEYLTKPDYDQNAFHLNISERITLEKAITSFELVPLTTEELNHNILHKRQLAYGDIGGQLDMIYWDKVNNTNLWQDHIAKVKTDNPKNKE